MDLVLVSIAALSLIIAIAMGVILFRVLREERQRSDARVAMLAAASAKFDLPLAPPVVAPDAAPRVTAGISPLAASAGTRRAPAATETEAVLHEPGELFAVADVESPWGRRIGVAAALAAVMIVAGYTLLPSRGGTPALAAAAAQQAPLELLALTHTQQPSGLTISGSVYNPRGGAPVSQVFATAVLFGPDGNFLTSARAPLDYTTLRPGDESPFVISVPVSGAVARYRIGFRGADGSVIAHVDRRADGTAADNAPAGRTPWAH